MNIINVHSRGFSVTPDTPEVKRATNRACLGLTEYEDVRDPRTGVTRQEVKDEYFLTNGRTWWFHISTYRKYTDLLREEGGLDAASISDYTDKHYVAGAGPSIGQGVTLREKQVPYVEFITDENNTACRILPATMGAGKTITSLYCAGVFNDRTIVFIEPRYVDTWLKECKFVFGFEGDITDHVRVVAGGELKVLIQDGLDGNITEKVILVSLNTMERYVSKVDQWDSYPVPPSEFFRVIGVGTKIVDEAHAWLRFHTVLDAINTTRRNIYLTATLVEEYPFRRSIENAVYPKRHRCPVTAPEKNTVLVAADYTYRHPGQVPNTKGPFGYSHHKLEKAILKSKKLTQSYLRMVSLILEMSWMKKDMPLGFKVLVYFSTTDMIIEFVKYMNEHYPEISTGSAKAGTGDEAFDEFQVIVATNKKAGTGVDIPKLSTVVDTIMVSKISENMQRWGRIRDIDKYDNHETLTQMYIYLYSNQVYKHADYNNKRFRLLGGLAKESRTYTVQEMV